MQIYHLASGYLSARYVSVIAYACYARQMCGAIKAGGRNSCQLSYSQTLKVVSENPHPPLCSHRCLPSGVPVSP
ncbi:hypothetical protein HOE425_333041 [Hoeflea sp. EC-HK425]|nr:hypothetical protein HOE425_333041 [Hoeflea sp. EC-HK425]